MIDFNTMAKTAMPNFKGGEKSLIAQMQFDGMNRIMTGCLEHGASIGTHKHETSSEILYVLRGVGTAVLDGTEETLLPGMCHYCPKGHTHSLKNNGSEDLVFFAVVPEQ